MFPGPRLHSHRAKAKEQHIQFSRNLILDFAGRECSFAPTDRKTVHSCRMRTVHCSGRHGGGLPGGICRGGVQEGDVWLGGGGCLSGGCIPPWTE